MAEEAKRGFWSRLFAPRSSGCCNLKVEEVVEGKAPAGEAEAGKPSPVTADKPLRQAGPCCGGGSASTGGGCCG